MTDATDAEHAPPVCSCSRRGRARRGVRRPPRPPPAPPAAPRKSRALAAFETVRACSSTRAARTATPRRRAAPGRRRRSHPQNVQRGPRRPGRAGARCATCHGTANLPASYGAHMPPGASNWRCRRPSRRWCSSAARGRAVRALKDPRQQRRQGHGGAAQARATTAGDLGLEPGRRPRAGQHAARRVRRRLPPLEGRRRSLPGAVGEHGPPGVRRRAGRSLRRGRQRVLEVVRVLAVRRSRSTSSRRSRRARRCRSRAPR